MHSPGQMTALDASIATRWITPGMNAAFEHYCFPVRNRTSRFNSYLYQSILPVTLIRRSWRRSDARRGAPGCGDGRQLERWEGEQLPEIVDLLARWRAFDLTGASDAELPRTSATPSRGTSAPG